MHDKPDELPSPSGRRCREATDEGFSGQYVPSDDTLIRPSGTFSRKREKGATRFNFNLFIRFTHQAQPKPLAQGAAQFLLLDLKIPKVIPKGQDQSDGQHHGA